MAMNSRADFPALNTSTIYLDSAATSHKPQVVLDALRDFYARDYATVRRGIYGSSEAATSTYEQARATVARFIGANPQEIIFTGGATAGINFVAQTWGANHIVTGDDIVVTAMEHHANLVPWQELAKATGAMLRIIPVHPDGTLDVSNLDSYITSTTKLVAVTHVSNVTGVTNPIALLRDRAHAVGAKILVDAAQSVPFGMVAVRTMKPDFLVFSGHKMMGPMGIGVLYINKDMQADVRPHHFGGGMVDHVTYQSATYAQAPQCYEAGTPPVAQAIGLAAAVNYLEQLPVSELPAHANALVRRFIDGVCNTPGISIVGPVEELNRNAHLVSFTVSDIHAHDVAAWLDRHGICVRAGDHCAQPYHAALGISSTIRVSFYWYNTPQDVDILVDTLKKLCK